MTAKMNVSIRIAHQRDTETVLTLWETLMDAHQEIDPVLYARAPQARQSYAAFLRRLRTDRDGLVLLASVEGEPVGYLAGGSGRRSPVYAVRDVGMIFDMAVKPDARRQGVGRALVRVALNEFKARKLPYAQVNFSPHNPSAASFWPQLGFQTFLYEAYLSLD